jgi:chromosome segregation ATPase
MKFGADIFANSSAYAAEAANVKAVMKEFSKSYYTSIFQDQLDDQNKVVESQGKGVTGLAKDKAKDEKAIAKATKKIEKAEKSKIKMQSKIDKLKKKIVSSDEGIRKNKEKIESKKGSAGKTAEELAKEEDKYKNVGKDQEAIKAKIRAIQAL